MKGFEHLGDPIISQRKSPYLREVARSGPPSGFRCYRSLDVEVGTGIIGARKTNLIEAAVCRIRKCCGAVDRCWRTAANSLFSRPRFGEATELAVWTFASLCTTCRLSCTPRVGLSTRRDAGVGRSSGL